MNKNIFPGSVMHPLPLDLREALIFDFTDLITWEDITDLARNDWICAIISAKKDETRARKIQRAIEKINEGKRRPCCWAGCIYRK